MQISGTLQLYSIIKNSKAASFNPSQADNSPAPAAESSENPNSKVSHAIDTSSLLYTQAAIHSTQDTRIINPMDWITQSDKDLVQKMTGLTVKNGDTYDESGNKVATSESSSLVNALYKMRTFGIPGDLGSTSGATGTITADDFAKYLKAYSTGSNVRDINIPIIEKAIESLQAQDKSANQSQS